MWLASFRNERWGSKGEEQRKDLRQVLKPGEEETHMFHLASVWELGSSGGRGEWQKLNYDIYTLRQIRREVRNRWKRILEDLGESESDHGMVQITSGFQKEADSLLSVTKLSTISDSKNTRKAREILLKLAEETTEEFLKIASRTYPKKPGVSSLPDGQKELHYLPFPSPGQSCERSRDFSQDGGRAREVTGSSETAVDPECQQREGASQICCGVWKERDLGKLGQGEELSIQKTRHHGHKEETGGELPSKAGNRFELLQIIFVLMDRCFFEHEFMPRLDLSQDCLASAGKKPDTK
ncbi:hypothetical protein GH733_008455 [Mirounga leonina]|nr:hypothetical protein GH733_008455 [Mirounga leonina]